ncbi:MAG: dTMP kinase [Thermoanaerobaculia bacterium]
MPLVTFEGIEGSGKSTQARRAADFFRSRVPELLLEREPGGTEIGSAIRALLLDPARRNLDPMAELLLIEADRRQHVVETLAPALARGALVLCDRFNDATFAYQGGGRGIENAVISQIDGKSTADVRPDLTLLFDCPPEIGLARARRREGGSADRFEGENEPFHRRVRDAYLEIARREPRRVQVLDSTQDADAVFREVAGRISRLLA